MLSDIGRWTRTGLIVLLGLVQTAVGVSYGGREMVEQVEVAVIGAGQAGLAISYYLTQYARTHVVLEKDRQVGSAWRHGRWDSFTLLTPNWSVRLPGFPYRGDDPDGFMARAEVVSHLEQYASSFGA